MNEKWISGSGPWFHLWAGNGVVATVHDGDSTWKGKWLVRKGRLVVAEGQEASVVEAMEKSEIAIAKVS